jgi:arylsulfatase A-like enzyme
VCRGAGLIAGLIAGLMPAVLGCRPDAAGSGASNSSHPGRSLLEIARPTVVVESAELGPPIALRGSRFLTGWTPLRRGALKGAHPYRMKPAATLELVVLGASPGAPPSPPPALILGLAEGSPTGGRLAVTVAGQPVDSVAVADPIRIPMPAHLAPGKTIVGLNLQDGEPPIVARGVIRPSQPAGTVSVEEGALVQNGRSDVEFLFPATTGLEIIGRFVPPANSPQGTSFRATVERIGGDRKEAFVWRSGLWNRLVGERGFRLAVEPARNPAHPSREDPASDFVRLRLESRGQGGAARWQDLRVVGMTPEPGAQVAEPDPQPTRPRLVIVYVMDALRADYVGALGGEADGGSATPTWDRLAGEGLLAANHRATAPNTMPSSKALFVGRPFVFRGGNRLRAEDGPTLAEAFRAAGFHTGLFSGNVHVSPAYGMDRGFDVAPGEVLFDRHATSANDGPGSTYNDNAERVQRAALAWLDSLPPGSSAFLYLHTLHPHNPYAPPEPFRSRYAPRRASGGGELPAALDGETSTLLRINRGRLSIDERGRQYLRGLYRGSLAYNDAVLADFLREIARRVPPEATLIALTSDHGEELFDHGGVLHGYTLYEELLRIPLVLWAPGRIAPRRVEIPTDTLDLHATLLRLLEPRTREPDPFLAPRDPDLPRFAAASSLKGGIFSIQNRRWKIIWAPRTSFSWGMGDGIGRGRDAELWFRLDRDPGETVNRLGDPDPEAQWLRARLFAWIDEARSEQEHSAGAAAPEEDTPTDPDTVRALKALGYLN